MEALVQNGFVWKKKIPQQTKKIILDTSYLCRILFMFIGRIQCIILIFLQVQTVALLLHPLFLYVLNVTMELNFSVSFRLVLGWASPGSQPTFPITSSVNVLGLRYKFIMPLPIESLIFIQINVWQCFQRAMRGFLLMEVLRM